MRKLSIFYYKGEPNNQLFGNKYFMIKINIAQVGEINSPYMFCYTEVANWVRQCKYLNDDDRKDALDRAIKHLPLSGA